jgi:hypothetical protein
MFHLNILRATAITIVASQLCFSSSSLFAGKSASQGAEQDAKKKKQSKDMSQSGEPTKIVNETDQTDIFAIPLDNDEMEENQQVKELMDRDK